MKLNRLFAAAIVLSCLWGSQAEAQIESGDIKASIDAGIMRWMKREDTVSDGGFSSKSKLDVTGSGAFIGAGAAVGYAVSKYLIPSLYFSLQNAKNNDSDFETTIRTWELKPSLEIALLPSLRFVPFVDVGLSLQGQVFKTDDSEEDEHSKTKQLAIGPALGVGVHLFAVQHASFDLSFNYRGVFKVQSSGAEDLGQLKESKQHNLLLNLGASLWI